METGIAKAAAREDQKRKAAPCERPQGSHFHDPDLMNNPTKTAKGDEMTSQASSSSLPIIQPSIQLMPQLSKRFFRCFADKAEMLFSFRLTCRRMDERVESNPQQ